MSDNEENRVLSQSLAESLRGHERLRALPAVEVIQDPAPRAYVTRAWGGAGGICLSRGLLTLLNETELRAVLCVGFDRLQSRGITWASVCARCARRLAPNHAATHSEFPLFTPPRAVLYWLTFPFYRQFARRAASVDLLRQPPATTQKQVPKEHEEAWASALFKANRVTKIHSASA
jgi:hypothetical protein